MSGPFVIRDMRPGDEAACIGFVDDLQVFEKDFEPDRRVDATAGRDYYAVLMKRVTESRGRVFILEQGGQACGWAVFVEEPAPVYVIDADRKPGFVAELFVSERLRGQGAGRALLDACEQEARARGLNLMMIGVHAANGRAERVYRNAGFVPYSMQLRKYL